MKGLKTLIRLEKNKLDALRKELAVMEGEKLALEAESARLLQALEDELKMAQDMTEMRSFFGDFSNRIKRQREQIAQQVAQLERKMGALRDKIAVAFSDMKKYEIALENHQKREKERRENLEQQQFDELAGQRFRRQQEERQ